MKKNRLTLIDVYKEYPYSQDTTSPYYCTKKEFTEINKAFNLLLVRYLINTGELYKFPGGLGNIKVRKRKARLDEQFIDFKKTKALGKTVHFQNMHSGGFYARFKWYKNRVSLANKNAFKFNPVRAAKRFLAKSIKERNTILNYTID